MTRRQAAGTIALSLPSLLGFAGAADGGKRIRIKRLPEGAIQPQVASDENGVIHVVYYSGDPRAGQLAYIRSADHGATFSRPISVNESGSAVAAGTIRGAQVAVGADGQVHVAWNGSPTAKVKGPADPATGKTEAPMLYTRLSSDGSHFEAERNLMVRSHGLDGGGSVAADRSGNVYVFWHALPGDEPHGLDGESRRRVWVARSADGGHVFEAEQPGWEQATGACGCCGMKALADGDGRLYTLYRSATEAVHRDIYFLHSRDRALTFRGKLLHSWQINACPMSSMDVATNGRRIVAAWETGGQVYWCAIDPVSGRSDEPIPAPGEASKRKHPRVALNKAGDLLMVWTEGTGWQKGGSAAWQCYDRAGNPAESGSGLDVPVWSFAAPVASADGTFTILY